MRIDGHTSFAARPRSCSTSSPTSATNYDPTIDHEELLTGEPVGVGTRFRCTSSSRRRPVEMTVEIVEYDRTHRLVTVTRLAGMDITSSLRFKPDGDSARLHWSSELHPDGFLRLLTPLLVVFGRRQTNAIWANLKQTLEAHPAVSGDRP